MIEQLNRLKPSLWLLPQGALYLGPLPINKLHSHRALQVLISLSKELEIDQGFKKNLISGQAAIIPSFVKHRVGTHWKFAFSFFYEPGLLLGIPDFTNAENPILFELNKKLLAGLSKVKWNSEQGLIKEIFSDCINTVGFELRSGVAPSVKDERINQVLTEISTNLAECTFQTLVDKIELSPGRFTHLFTEQTGMSFRSYLLWIRIKKALEIYSKESNFTYAAHEAGFSDSAHFSRIFSRTFGFPPSFLRYTNFSCIN